LLLASKTTNKQLASFGKASFWRCEHTWTAKHQSRSQCSTPVAVRLSQEYAFVAYPCTLSICNALNESFVLGFFSSFNSFNVSLVCGKDSEIKAKDTIACRECGHRILYKKRTKRGQHLIVYHSFIYSLAKKSLSFSRFLGLIIFVCL
jgi:DNA-directed RNA polymerase subunit RPC12/RpoP